jgi:nucleoside-diphosphate-sugar epimerase
MRVVQLSVSALLVVLSCSAATVLVTGGMGGLGRSVVTELLRRGHSVVSLDVRDRRTELAALGGDLSNHRFVRGDVRNTSLLAEIFRAGVEGIVHLAALSGQACENRPELCRSVNVGGTRALVSVLEAGHDIAVPPWLVLGSTTEVFGDQCATAACTEESSTAPVTVFGTTMLQAEDVLGQSRLRFRGLLLLRFSDLYGDVWERTGRVARLVLAARASQVIDTSANESVLLLNLVSLVDAAVVVGKAVDLLQSGLTPGYLELLLVCSGLATPYDQTVDAVLALTASSSPLRQTDELGSSFLGDPSRLKRVLGVSVGGDLASGLRAHVLGVLAVELSQLTSQESTACAHPELDVAALDGCAVFVTVFGDFPDDVEYRAQHHLVAAAELRRIDVTRRFHLLGLASGLDLDFALDLPDAYYEADYDASSGGYRLLVNADEPDAHTFNLSLPLPSSLGVEGTLLSLVSIRAYSCPPRVEGSVTSVLYHTYS